MKQGDARYSSHQGGERTDVKVRQGNRKRGGNIVGKMIDKRKGCGGVR